MVRREIIMYLEVEVYVKDRVNPVTLLLTELAEKEVDGFIAEIQRYGNAANGTLWVNTGRECVSFRSNEVQYVRIRMHEK